MAAASVSGNISQRTVTAMRKNIVSLTRGHTSQYDKLQAALVDKSKILMFVTKVTCICRQFLLAVIKSLGTVSLNIGLRATISPHGKPNNRLVK